AGEDDRPDAVIAAVQAMEVGVDLLRHLVPERIHALRPVELEHGNRVVFLDARPFTLDDLVDHDTSPGYATRCSPTSAAGVSRRPQGRPSDNAHHRDASQL